MSLEELLNLCLCGLPKCLYTHTCICTVHLSVSSMVLVHPTHHSCTACPILMGPWSHWPSRCTVAPSCPTVTLSWSKLLTTFHAEVVMVGGVLNRLKLWIQQAHVSLSLRHVEWESGIRSMFLCFLCIHFISHGALYSLSILRSLRTRVQKSCLVNRFQYVHRYVNLKTASKITTPDDLPCCLSHDTVVIVILTNI